MGYHLKTIAKGKLGEFSKITEEILELRDSQERLRPNPMLALCELCDLIGAIEAYAAARNISFAEVKPTKDSIPTVEPIQSILLSYARLAEEDRKGQVNPATIIDLLVAIQAYGQQYKLTLDDLIAMMELTKSAFAEGRR
jgi:hypothetical protein